MSNNAQQPAIYYPGIVDLLVKILWIIFLVLAIFCEKKYLGL